MQTPVYICTHIHIHMRGKVPLLWFFQAKVPADAWKWNRCILFALMAMLVIKLQGLLHARPEHYQWATNQPLRSWNSVYVAQNGLKLVILLPQSSKCWDWGCKSTYLASRCVLRTKQDNKTYPKASCRYLVYYSLPCVMAVVTASFLRRQFCTRQGEFVFLKCL